MSSEPSFDNYPFDYGSDCKNMQHYRRIKRLGRGSFAAVDEAIDTRDKKKVAIKMIGKDFILKRNMKKRVQEEVAIHASLHNPFIVKCFDYQEGHKFVYLVLELCGRGSLQKHLDNCKESKLHEDEVRKFVWQIAQGLLCLHKRGFIIHRDLTLNNILLTDSMEAKIADFGLATKLDHPNQKHLTMCGTPSFMAPEVAKRTRHGKPVDLWALGIILYILLVGHPPFEDDDIQRILKKVVKDDPQVPGNVSKEAKDLIMKLLEKNPMERISLDEVLEHPFLEKCRNTQHYFGQEGQCPSHQSRDSGMGTMSTQGNHSLQQSQHNRNALKKSCRPGAVASIEELCENGCSQSSQPSHQFSEPTRSRSRSEDRFHRSGGASCKFKSKPSSGAPIVFASLPSKHRHKPNSYHAQNQENADGLSCNLGGSSCSINCGHHVNRKRSTLTRAQSFEHQSSDRRDLLREENCTCDNHKRHGNPTHASIDRQFEDGCRVSDRSIPKSSRSVDAGYSHCSHSPRNMGEGAHIRDYAEPSGSYPASISTGKTVGKEERQENKVSSLVVARSKHSCPTAGETRHLPIDEEELYRQLFTTLKQESGPAVRPSPLNTKRLLPRRDPTERVVMSILESGGVVLEFLKTESSGEKRVVEVCRISRDGLIVRVYKVNRGKGSILRDKPPDLPADDCGLCSFENLPKTHWKKYERAARYVNLVRAKTPKVTFYSDKAKCYLMENEPNPDFECSFYNGCKISRTCEGVRLINREGREKLLTSRKCLEDLSSVSKDLFDHFLQCFSHCLRVERSMADFPPWKAQDDNDNGDGRHVFPVIVGRRPHGPATALQSKENVSIGTNRHQVSPITAMLPSVESSWMSTAPWHSGKSYASRTPDIIETPVSRHGSSRSSAKGKRLASPVGRMHKGDALGVQHGDQQAPWFDHRDAYGVHHHSESRFPGPDPVDGTPWDQTSRVRSMR